MWRLRERRVTARLNQGWSYDCEQLKRDGYLASPR